MKKNPNLPLIVMLILCVLSIIGFYFYFDWEVRRFEERIDQDFGSVHRTIDDLNTKLDKDIERIRRETNTSKGE